MSAPYLRTFRPGELMRKTKKSAEVTKSRKGTTLFAGVGVLQLKRYIRHLAFRELLGVEMPKS